MNLENKQIVETVGVIAVILSLLFVGVQLYFDRKVAIVDQYISRAESRKADLRAELESDAFTTQREAMWELGDRPAWWTEELESFNNSYYEQRQASEVLSSRSTLEQVRYRLIFTHFDAIYFQYAQGLLEEEVWLAILNSMEGGIQDPIVRATWENHNPRLPLSDILEELILELENEG